MKAINTYLIFDGNCRKAMEFYKKCLGGKLSIMDYGDAPGCEKMPAKYKKWVIHARLTIGNEVLMASDTRIDMPVHQGNNFFISIQGKNVAHAQKLFKALSYKGKVEMPPQETFFAKSFCMFTDQFGIKWMINVEK